MSLLYSEAARILEAIDNKKGTIKSLCLSNKVFQNKKQLYALVCETLKYRKVIRQVLEATKLLKLEKALTKHTAELLVYDFLIGRGINLATKKIKDAVLKHKSALKAALARLKIKANVSSNKDLLPDEVKDKVTLPRYVRVNTLKTTIEEVLDHFSREGYTHIAARNFSYQRYIDLLSKLRPKQVVSDLHIPELLIFAPKTDLHDHVLYLNGDIILQDKASCLPAYILAPPPSSHVIDCCAAPGNKTTHAASYLNNQGKIVAFDLDSRRLATMATMTLKAGVLCAELINQDFLKVNVKDPKYAKVTHAIVDPSCSGSGIVSRLNTLTDDKDSSSTARLDKLAGFQQSVLSHALTFPAIKRVVYSTCSIHETENEQVVQAVLRKFKGQFKLVDPGMEALCGRGVGEFPGWTHCVRMEPSRDLTNGFFVACFEKVASGEEQNDAWFNTSTEVVESEVDSDMEDGVDETGDKGEQKTVEAGVKGNTQGTDNVNIKKKKKRIRKKKKKTSEENVEVGKSCESDVNGIIEKTETTKRAADIESDEVIPNKKLKMSSEDNNHDASKKKKKQKRKKKQILPVTM